MINGLYEIIEMDIWDKDTSGLAERARISINGNKGKLHFIGFDAQMNIKKTGDRYLFTWMVNSESNPVSGYGNFTCSGDTLTGRIYMHDSNDSAFVAVKTSQAKKYIRIVNRGLLVVKAREPFREWVDSLPGKDKITLRDINNDCSAYLIPEFEDHLQRDTFLNTIYADIFVKQLLFWCHNDIKWPRNRSFALFNRWFKLEFQSTVEDIAEYDLVHSITNSIYEVPENGNFNSRE
jgi:hypothetical protein